VTARTPRTPEQSRARIIEAATEEFAAHGLAGARVERIARRAQVSKQLLYHHYGDKKQLFGEVLHRMVVETSALLASPPPEPDQLVTVLAAAVGDEEGRWLRLLQWEALEAGTGEVVREDERAEEMARFVALVREGQAHGALPADLDAAQLGLALIAVATFPYVLPQFTRLVTGAAPVTPEFAARHGEFVAGLTAHLAAVRAEP
jgi:AcrR family transcriptional regulator